MGQHRVLLASAAALVAIVAIVGISGDRVSVRMWRVAGPSEPGAGAAVDAPKTRCKAAIEATSVDTVSIDWSHVRSRLLDSGEIEVTGLLKSVEQSEAVRQFRCVVPKAGNVQFIIATPAPTRISP
jgi:hypothetical protein